MNIIIRVIFLLCLFAILFWTVKLLVVEVLAAAPSHYISSSAHSDFASEKAKNYRERVLKAIGLSNTDVRLKRLLVEYDNALVENDCQQDEQPSNYHLDAAISLEPSNHFIRTLIAKNAWCNYLRNKTNENLTVYKATLNSAIFFGRYEEYTQHHLLLTAIENWDLFERNLKANIIEMSIHALKFHHGLKEDIVDAIVRNNLSGEFLPHVPQNWQKRKLKNVMTERYEH
ncbi:hypothetical protein PN836_020370 [Ningiella sp. W23]|uniref:hypothetical protein n=1 Tax=Ningiella sp. W23 TaxID=3023715 RepID=UPI003757A8BA